MVALSGRTLTQINRYGSDKVGTLTAEVQPWDVRVGSKAALTAPKSNFRFTPDSGLRSDIAPCPKSAMALNRCAIAR